MVDSKPTTTSHLVGPARSKMMASVRSKNTQPELVVRSVLFERGFRYRLNCRKLPGSPDLVLRRYKAVIFVHGCFWHRHNSCRYFQLPKTRREFWLLKLEANAARDSRNVEELLAMGWRVAVVWECASRHARDRLATELVDFLKGDATYVEIRD